MVLLTFAILIAAGTIIQRLRQKKEVPNKVAFSTGKNIADVTLDLGKFPVPGGVFISEGHTWASVQPTGEVKIGITSFAQNIFSRIDGLTARAKGDSVEQGEELIAIRQGNREAQFDSPISGEILAVNENLSKNPSLIKSNHYEAGWIYILKPKNLTQEIRFLRIADDAIAWIKSEVERLKHFLMAEYSQNELVANSMADGGLPTEGFIDHISEESWKRFKSEFLS